MSKYIIFDLNGNKLDSYEGELDEKPNSRSYNMCPPNTIHMLLPDGMDEDCVTLTEVIPAVLEVHAQAAKWVKDGFPDLYTEPTDPSYTYVASVIGTPHTDPAYDFIPAQPDMWTKAGMPTLYIDPLDVTFTFVPAKAEHWIKSVPSPVLVDPLDATFTYIPATATTPEMWAYPAQPEIFVEPVNPNYIASSPEKWTKVGSPDLLVKPVDLSYTYVAAIAAVKGVPAHRNVVQDVALAQKKNANAKEKIIANMYEALNQDIFAEMYLVFGTTKSDSATANYSTWQAMLLKPEIFVHQVAGLDTIELVVAYAQGKIDAATNYALYRLKRIAQYKTAVLAL